MKTNLIAIITLLCGSILYAQKSETLFTVNENPISVKEFERVYKKNLDLIKDESQKDIDQYLTLYVNYKLKLEEARALGLDKDKKYMSELRSYRRQLAKKYLTDTEVTDQLLKEAYERTVEEVNADHILVRIDENASPSDTLKAYNQIVALKARAEKEGFEKVRSEVHNGATIFGEKLGSFGAFKMVYPFENAAYKTPIGQTSNPFKTRFGYHIVHVNDKQKSKGEVTVAHIMVALNNENLTTTPEKKINEIQAQLEAGAKFEDLAKQFSDDKNSAKIGGKLSRFGAGKLNSKPFEDAAFSLTEPRQVSQPVKTKFGWHLIMLIKKHDIGTFDEVKGALERKILRDTRSSVINNKFYNTLRTRYNVKQDEQAIAKITKVVDTKFMTGQWKPDNNKQPETLVSFADRKISYQDYYTFINSRLRKYRPLKDNNLIIKNSLNDFINSEIYKYHDAHLEDNYEDFAVVLQEYKEGLLLFELMEKEIWQKSKSDTLGLKAYYEQNKNNYKWSERIGATIVTLNSKKAAKFARKQLAKNVETNALKEQLKTKFTDKDFFDVAEGTFEKGSKEIPSKYKIANGVSKVFKHNNQFVVIKTKEIIAPAIMPLDEVKGKVISDYQEQIEKDWISKLRKKYAVKINQSILDRIKKEFRKS